MSALNKAIPKNAKFWSWGIIGMKGAGKSSILLNILDTHLKKYYDNIYLVSTTALLDDKFKELIKELVPEGKFFDHFNEQVIQQIMDEILEYNEEWKKGKPRSLVILDDCISDLPKSTEKNSAFNRFFVGSRHFRCEIALTSQSYKKLNTLIRNNLDIITLHHSNNKRELKNLEDEINMPPEDLHLYMKAIEDDPHDNLTINFMEGKPIVVKNFKNILSIKDVSSD
jgi:polyhydroxyalkanoate synthesis regulator phasin